MFQLRWTIRIVPLEENNVKHAKSRTIFRQTYITKRISSADRVKEIQQRNIKSQPAKISSSKDTSSSEEIFILNVSPKEDKDDIIEKYRTINRTLG